MSKISISRNGSQGIPDRGANWGKARQRNINIIWEKEITGHYEKKNVGLSRKLM